MTMGNPDPRMQQAVALVHAATEKLKPFHVIVDDPEGAPPEDIPQKVTTLLTVTNLLAGGLRNNRQSFFSGCSEEYWALYFAHTAIDAYIQLVRPGVTFEAKVVDWQYTLPPIAELEMHVQVTEILLGDLEHLCACDDQ